MAKGDMEIALLASKLTAVTLPAPGHKQLFNCLLDYGISVTGNYPLGTSPANKENHTTFGNHGLVTTGGSK
jgi:hypothetical protein